MATNPTRLRNWAGFVREGSAPAATVANMLEFCAKKFEQDEARIKELESEKERLRGSLVRIVSEGHPDEAWDRAYEEARNHEVLND